MNQNQFKSIPQSAGTLIKKMVSKPLFMVIALMLLISSTANASHFRYGLITATRLTETATTVTYRLNVALSWRLTTAPTINSFAISGGNSGSVNVSMTNVTDPSGGWTNSTGNANVTLNKTTAATTIRFTSCCKISTIANNNDQNWDVYTVLRTGAPGSTPVSTLPAIINMPIGAPSATFAIPASDPDPGSTLTYGFPNLASGNLAGQTEPPGFTVNPSTGLITFNTVGKSIGQQYNAMVTVTDNDGNQVMLDFLINMVGPSNPPVFDYTPGNTPINGSVFNIIVGQTLTFPIVATDPDAGQTVNYSVSGLTAFLTTSNFSPALPANGNPAITNLSYTAAAPQLGSTIILNFIATDNVGVQTTSAVTIRVVGEPAPTFISPTPAEGTIRAIETGVPLSDVITAQSSLGSNVSIAFATVPSGAVTSPAVPTAGANPGTTTLNWTPTPADFGIHTVSYQATISATPTIFATRTYMLIVNTLPVFMSAASASTTACNSFTHNVVVDDADIPYGDVVDIIAHGLPAWLTLTPTGNGTATISGTPSLADVGTYTIHLHAEDLNHHSYEEVEQTLTITVTANSIVATAGANGSVTPAGTTAVCPGSTSVYTITADAGYHVNDVLVDGISVGAVSSYTFTSIAADHTINADFAPDCIPATISVCPTNVTVNNAAGTCGAVVTYGDATADGTDPVVTYSHASGTVFTVGVTTITVTATNACGTATCTFDVTVNDNEYPTISGVADVTTTADAGVCAANPALGTVTANDNCPGVTITNDAPSSFPVGTTVVTYTATDAHGHVTTATQNVTVSDDESPVARCRNYTLSLTSGSGTISTSNVDNGSTDNCEIATMSVSPSTFTCANAGANTVTLTVTDIHGNVSTCNAIVTVQYQPSCAIAVNPSTTTYTGGIPNNIYLGYGPQTATLAGSATGGSGFTYSWAPSTYLSCTSCASPVFTPTAAGTITYTLTVTNSNGCSTKCTVTMCVVDAVDREGKGKDKVLICHVPPGLPSHPLTLSISASAVPAHITGHAGDHIGPCNVVCGTSGKFAMPAGEVIEAGEMTMTLYPNPFNDYVHIKIQSDLDQTADVILYDITGRVMEQKNGQEMGADITIGQNMIPGIYVVEVRQGEVSKRVKVVKL